MALGNEAYPYEVAVSACAFTKETLSSARYTQQEVIRDFRVLDVKARSTFRDIYHLTVENNII